MGTNGKRHPQALLRRIQGESCAGSDQGRVDAGRTGVQAWGSSDDDHALEAPGDRTHDGDLRRQGRRRLGCQRSGSGTSARQDRPDHRPGLAYRSRQPVQPTRTASMLPDAHPALLPHFPKDRLGVRAGLSDTLPQTLLICVRSYPTVSGDPPVFASVPVYVIITFVKFSDSDSTGASPPLDRL
jgi:hypothetical protein